MAGYTCIGKIEAFEDAVDSWTAYTERLEVNGITGGKRVPALHSLIGGKTYALLRNLTTPDKQKDKSFNEIVKVLKDHLSPKPLVIAERFRFHKREQKEGESVNEYVAQIRKLSEYCDFQDLNNTLRDRFVCGLQDEQTQKKLLSVQGLTLDEAMQIAVAMEIASKDAMELQGKSRESGVNKLKFQKSKARFEKPKSGNCYRCNKSGHRAEECRFNDATCHKCKKKGHIKVACRAKDKSFPKKVHAVDEDGCCDLGLYSVHTGKRNEIMVDVCIDGKRVNMEVDTGSALSIVPESFYRTVSQQKTEGHKCNLNNLLRRKTETSWSS